MEPSLCLQVLLYGQKKSCHNIYEEFVECADPTGCGLGNAALAWDYQVPPWAFLLLCPTCF